MARKTERKTGNKKVTKAPLTKRPKRAAAKKAPLAKKKKAPPAKKTAPAKKKKAPAERPAATSIAALGERDVDEALVESTVALLDAHDQRDAASRRQIGEHLLEGYYGGDAQKVRDRAPDKPLSFAHLAARAEEDTSWSARDLRDAVVGAIVYRSLPDQIARLLKPTYLRRLDAVDDPSVRAELAARLARGELRGRAAEEAIAIASGAVARGGRTRTPGPVRLARRVYGMMDDAADFGGFDVDQIAGMNEAARAEIAGTLDDASRRLSALAARIRAVR